MLLQGSLRKIGHTWKLTSKNPDCLLYFLCSGRQCTGSLLWERVEGLLGYEGRDAAHLALPEGEGAFPHRPGMIRKEASGQELELGWG